MLEKFGYVKEDSGSGEKELHCTLSAAKSTLLPNGKALRISCNNDKISIVDSENIEFGFWDKSNLKKAFEGKYKNKLLYAKAESRGSGAAEEFRFVEAYALSGFSYEAFVKLLEQGKILIDLRIGYYHSGSKKGKTHDHGTAFRILQKNIPLLFKERKSLFYRLFLVLS